MPDLVQQNVQWFPIYYPMGPTSFLDGDGEPSGAVGATARLSREIPNWPILFLGIRLSNVYTIGTAPSNDDVNLFNVLKRHVDGEQTVRISLSQQNITAEATLQLQVTGKDAFYWAPFPYPYPMAGGNNIAVEVRRVTAYPTLGGEDIEPQLFGTILAQVARTPSSADTMPPMRVIRPGA
jgi:hypothetical protein